VDFVKKDELCYWWLGGSGVRDGWWLVKGCGGGGGKWRDEAYNLVSCIVRGRYDAMNKVRKPSLLF
jgi:hypothetical protein